MEWRDDYFFSRASCGPCWPSARSRKFSRARFHGTVLCKHTGCQRQAAELMQAALWLRLPSVRSMFPYDLYLRLIVVSYLTRENFLLLLFFLFWRKRKIISSVSTDKSDDFDGRTLTSSVFRFYYDSLALNCALPMSEPEPSRH